MRYSRLLRRLEVEGGPSHVDSKTWLVELDEQFRVQGQPRLVVEPHRDPDGVAKNGLTDPRLFRMAAGDVGGNVELPERVLRDDCRSDTTNTIVVGWLRGAEIDQLTPIASPHGYRREKNWMPWVKGDELRFIYAPANLEVYRYKDASLELVNKMSQPDPRLAGYSGSSQVQRSGDDWIFAVHYAARMPQKATAFLLPSYYLHRFVVISDDCSIRAISPEFFLEHRGTEFCAGLAIDLNSVIVSYGYEDHGTRIMKISRTKLNSILGL